MNYARHGLTPNHSQAEPIPTITDTRDAYSVEYRYHPN